MDQRIPIRPLTMRGVFGIAKTLVTRRFGALLGYVLLYGAVVWALMLIACLPAGITFLSQGGDMGPAGVIAIVISALLLFVAALAISIALGPIYAGTLYQEFSARIFGEGAGIRGMLRRSKHNLRRFFTTALCLVVCMMAISAVTSVISGALSLIVGIMTAWTAVGFTVFEGALNPGGLGVGAVLMGVIVGLVMGGVVLAGQSFVAFVYPAAVNENIKNFDAVGRSMRLSVKRFGRILLCRLIVGAALLFVELILMLLIALALILAEGEAIGWIIAAALGLAAAFATLFAGLYMPALDTVLYFDTRVRLEGTEWLGPDTAPAAPAAPEAAEEPQADYFEENAESSENITEEDQNV